jgi:hypothetical protein
MARLTGLEPATSGVTGRHSNQLSYNRPLRTRGNRPKRLRFLGPWPGPVKHPKRRIRGFSFRRARAHSPWPRARMIWPSRRR